MAEIITKFHNVEKNPSLSIPMLLKN